MNVLPDSRLRNPKGAVMADAVFLDRETGLPVVIRLEMVPIFCFNCGKDNGYVTSNMSFVSWLCQDCEQVVGREASLCCCSDQVFWDKVQEEMLATYGHAMTQAELTALAERHELSRGLQLLERESPYR